MLGTNVSIVETHQGHAEDTVELAQVAGRPAPELSVIVPTYNEALNIGALVSALHRALVHIRWEVIFVDDDSPDGTIDVVRKLGADDDRVRGLRRLARRGLSGAVIEGICASSAPFIAVMDCDLQHDETLLPQMLTTLESGADLVIASRYASGASSQQGLSRGRQLGSEFGSFLSRTILKSDVTDPLSGNFMMRRSTFDAVAPKLSTSGFKILLDILLSSSQKLSVEELAYNFRPRSAGASKLDSTVVAEFVGLLVSKMSGGLVSPRFFMFAGVGASGIVVHLLALSLVLQLQPTHFGAAQLIASYVAMTWNFFVNNVFTYRDKKLKGASAIKGLLSFYAICSVGAAANLGVAQLVYSSDPNWLLAGFAGAVMAAVFNYAMSATFTWRVRP